MGRQQLGARLYLDPIRKQWAIRDGNKFVRTGLAEADLEEAQVRLYRHLNRKRSRWRRTIYFVTCDVADFPVKIGISADVDERLRDLNTALPFPVVVLATISGTSLDEIAIQQRFSDLNIRGEWFQRADRLMSFIESTGSRSPMALKPHPFACQSLRNRTIFDA